MVRARTVCCLSLSMLLGATLLRAAPPAAPRFPGARVLYIDSYHAEYAPGILQREALGKVLAPAGVELKIIFLDEKRAPAEDSLRRNARTALDAAFAWKPSVIVAADDAAAAYVIAPHLRDGPFPVVFIGVNWTAAAYGFPTRWVTGQVEVELIRELREHLLRLGRGTRLALITGDTLTDRKTLDYYRQELKVEFAEVRLVNSFARWKEAWRELQGKADALVFRNNSGIEGWNDEEARAFVMAETKIPTGTVSVHLSPWVLVSLSKVNDEFGEWAGARVLEILDGRTPTTIPVDTNRRGRLVLHMRLAKKLGVVFPMDLVERAAFVEESPAR